MNSILFEANLLDSIRYQTRLIALCNEHLRKNKMKNW